jgi:hypothetical protein
VQTRCTLESLWLRFRALYGRHSFLCCSVGAQYHLTKLKGQQYRPTLALARSEIHCSFQLLVEHSMNHAESREMEAHDEALTHICTILTKTRHVQRRSHMHLRAAFKGAKIRVSYRFPVKAKVHAGNEMVYCTGSSGCKGSPKPGPAFRVASWSVGSSSIGWGRPSNRRIHHAGGSRGL